MRSRVFVSSVFDSALRITRAVDQNTDLELQLCPKLQLPRIEHVARRAEPERRRWWRPRVINAAPHGIDVLDVHPVEQVEHVEHEIEPGAAVERKLTAHPQVDARIRRSQ